VCVGVAGKANFVHRLRLAEVPHLETLDYSTLSSGILTNRLLAAVAVN